MRQWKDEEVFDLIHLYEEEEFLWSVNNKLYRNREKRESAYKEFASKFDEWDAEEIQRKIHNLRNQVSHELQKMNKKGKSGDGSENQLDSKWKFFSALKFMIPCFMPTPTISNMNNIPTNSDISLDGQSDNVPPQRPTNRKNSNKRQSQTQDDDILEEAINIMKKPKDDFDRFGEYVALELKTLESEYIRGLLKSDIRKAVAHYADMDNRQHWSKSIPSPLQSSSSTSSSRILSPIAPGFSSLPSYQTLTQTTQDCYNSFASINYNHNPTDNN